MLDCRLRLSESTELGVAATFENRLHEPQAKLGVLRQGAPGALAQAF